MLRPAWIGLALLVQGVTTAPLLVVEGRGVQVYTCAAEGRWTLVGPEATLFRDGAAVGSHSAGPRWTWADGSAVTGKVVTSAPAADPAKDVAWLTLATTPVAGTNGILTGAVTVKRTETHGGVAPETGCDATHLGSQTRVPYSATYSFYGPQT